LKNLQTLNLEFAWLAMAGNTVPELIRLSERGFLDHFRYLPATAGRFLGLYLKRGVGYVFFYGNNSQVSKTAVCLEE
jgi:hypothetical protein